VTLAVVAQDLVDLAPRCAITKVTSDGSHPNHDRTRDWRITGPLTVLLEGRGKHRDRAYTMTVQCTDVSGNSSSQQTAVVVPDRR
jgi:hypothetical protein